MRAPRACAALGFMLLGVVACKKNTPPAPPAEPVVRPAHAVVVETMKPFARGAKGVAAGDAGPIESPTETHALVGVPGGAVEIWTQRIVGRTEILVRSLDADGNPRGPVNVFDGLEGAIPWLTAVRSGPRVWIAWIASTKAAKSAMFGFVDAAAKEAALAYKVPVDIDDEGAAGSVRVAPREGGHAMFAAVTAKKPCTDPDAGSTCQIARWSVFGYPSFDHEQVTLRSGSLSVGTPNVVVDGLVDLGGAIFASASAWNDAPVLDFVLAPHAGHDGGALPDVRAIVPSPAPRPPFSVAFTGDVLVFRAPSQPWDDPKAKCPRPSFEQGLCEQIALVKVTKSGALHDVDAGAGTPNLWLPLTAVNELCADGRLTLDLVHPKGSVRLGDQPGAFVPELQGWTGRTLLALGENGNVTKRACIDGKLEAAAAR